MKKIVKAQYKSFIKNLKKKIVVSKPHFEPVPK